jgi:excisionase family DNA binding protein
MNQDLMTMDEMAERLKVPKSWLYSRTRETGKDAIPRVMVGKYIRFIESDVLDWLRERNERGGRRT